MIQPKYARSIVAALTLSHPAEEEKKMNRYRQYPPVFMFIIACIAAVVIILLAGCATTGQQPTLDDVKTQACPVILGTLAGLQVSPDIQENTKARLSEIEPVALAVCSTATEITDIKQMSEAVFAVVVDVVKDSNMTPEQKQTAIIAITTARLMIASYRVPQ